MRQKLDMQPGSPQRIHVCSTLKHFQRLDDSRLADFLREQAVVENDVLADLLEESRRGGVAFSEGLVDAGVVGDWELSRTVCELFNLPFMPVDMTKPDPELWSEFGQELLARHNLVPLCRFGCAVTVAMPGLISAKILGELSSATGMQFFPVVGTVETNRRWITDQAEQYGVQGNLSDVSGWGDMFDQADAEVLLDLDGEASTIEPMAPGEPLETVARTVHFPPMPEFGA